jgi:hypothetical protein
MSGKRSSKLLTPEINQMYGRTWGFRLKRYRKNATAFVKNQCEIHNRLQPKLLWISRHPKSLQGLTYVKKLHGELI